MKFVTEFFTASLVLFFNMQDDENIYKSYFNLKDMKAMPGNTFLNVNDFKIVDVNDVMSNLNFEAYCSKRVKKWMFLV